MIAKEDLDVLRFCGFLGHPYVVIVTLKDGTRSAAYHCNLFLQARDYALARDDNSPAIYFRGPRAKKWKLLHAT